MTDHRLFIRTIVRHSDLITRVREGGRRGRGGGGGREKMRRIKKDIGG